MSVFHNSLLRHVDAVLILGHMFVHGIVGFFGVVGADGLGDLGMSADGVLQQPLGAEVGVHLNAVGDDRHDLGDDAVVGALGDIGVEILVRRAVVLPFSDCLLYTSPSPRDLSTSRMPSSA